MQARTLPHVKLDQHDMSPRVKEKDHTIIPTDAEKASDKTEHPPGKRRPVKGPQGAKADAGHGACCTEWNPVTGGF